MANDLDAFIPELWAQESLMILEANMVAAQLVHRDFSPQIARFGDIVNTRLPATFTMQRKVDGDNVTDQDATATNVAVKLDQHIHTSFLIYDGEESKGFKTLRDEYLYPAVLSLAQGIDEIILGCKYQFLGNVVGKLGTDVTKSSFADLREKLNVNKVPMEGRNLIVTPNTETALLNIGDFTTAEKVGDEGTAMREGSLGRRFGINLFMSQNNFSIASGSTTVTGAINLGAGYVAGTTTVVVDGFSAAITAGSWLTIAGDMIPQRVVSTVGGATPTQIVISPGLASAVVDDAVVTVYTPGAINLGAGYAVGWTKAMTVDAFTVAPKRGQLISFGSATDYYSAINTPTTTSLLVNRALNAALADDAVAEVGPAGDYNFAFHRNALAFVNRPLAAPLAGTGARSFVVNYNGLSMRVTIAYDSQKQAHRVTCDMLCGVKVLDTNLGALLLA